MKRRIMEMAAEAKVLIVNQVCDKCDEGIMEYDRESIRVCHVGTTHKCNKCGYVKGYPTMYPYQRIVPIEVMRKPVGKEIVE